MLLNFTESKRLACEARALWQKAKRGGPIV
jgi:hypothetical protein